MVENFLPDGIFRSCAYRESQFEREVLVLLVVQNFVLGHERVRLDVRRCAVNASQLDGSKNALG